MPAGAYAKKAFRSWSVRERECVRACMRLARSYTRSLLARHVITRLLKFHEFHQIYVFGAVGDKDKLIIHRVRKKGATLFLPVTLRNNNRFSKFFYDHTLQ